MYDVAHQKELLLDEFKQKRCQGCGFGMKCDNMTNCEFDKCFRWFVEKEKVEPFLHRNGMGIDEWTCYGKMSIDSLIHLFLYLSYEEADSNG